MGVTGNGECMGVKGGWIIWSKKRGRTVMGEMGVRKYYFMVVLMVFHCIMAVWENAQRVIIALHDYSEGRHMHERVMKEGECMEVALARESAQ